MPNGESPSYRFHGYVLDIAERRLYYGSTLVPISPKVFDVLVYLVEREGHLVLKDELLRAVWPDRFVEEVNLARAIHTIRTTLARFDNVSNYIETVPTKGYRFVAEVLKFPLVSGSGPLHGSEVEPTETQSEMQFPAALRPTPTTPEPSNFIEAVGFRAHKPRLLIILLIAVTTIFVSTGSWFALHSQNAFPGIMRSMVQTRNGEAYRHYQQGRFLIERDRLEDRKQALASFERAVELDPNFAAAYAGKADAEMRIFWVSTLHDDIIQSRAAIQKAIELDSSNSYAHTLLCRLKGTYDYDFKGAESECRRAVELDPNFHEARREMAMLLIALGRNEEAMAEIDAAVALAPTSTNKRLRGMILYFTRRYDEAVEQWRQVVETDPNDQVSLRWLSNVYEVKRDFSRAFDARIRQMEISGATPDEIEAAKRAFYSGGWTGFLRSMPDSKVPNLAGATKYAQLGENDKAFEILENMFDRRAVMLVQIDHEPRLDPLKHDPRFGSLLKRIGLS